MRYYLVTRRAICAGSNPGLPLLNAVFVIYRALPPAGLIEHSLFAPDIPCLTFPVSANCDDMAQGSTF